MCTSSLHPESTCQPAFYCPSYNKMKAQRSDPNIDDDVREWIDIITSNGSSMKRFCGCLPRRQQQFTQCVSCNHTLWASDLFLNKTNPLGLTLLPSFTRCPYCRWQSEEKHCTFCSKPLCVQCTTHPRAFREVPRDVFAREDSTCSRCGITACKACIQQDPEARTMIICADTSCNKVHCTSCLSQKGLHGAAKCFDFASCTLFHFNIPNAFFFTLNSGGRGACMRHNRLDAERTTVAPTEGFCRRCRCEFPAPSVFLLPFL